MSKTAVPSDVAAAVAASDARIDELAARTDEQRARSDERIRNIHTEMDAITACLAALEVPAPQLDNSLDLSRYDRQLVMFDTPMEFFFTEDIPLDEHPFVPAAPPLKFPAPGAALSAHQSNTSQSSAKTPTENLSITFMSTAAPSPRPQLWI
eukprot:m.27783 g.27783  ORF g.27783 m.27783 type:complete len:152 (+) comp4831_c0_seq1:539-994(+)